MARWQPKVFSSDDRDLVVDPNTLLLIEQPTGYFISPKTMKPLAPVHSLQINRDRTLVDRRSGNPFDPETGHPIAHQDAWIVTDKGLLRPRSAPNPIHTFKTESMIGVDVDGTVRPLLGFHPGWRGHKLALSLTKIDPTAEADPFLVERTMILAVDLVARGMERKLLMSTHGAEGPLRMGNAGSVTNFEAPLSWLNDSALRPTTGRWLRMGRGYGAIDAPGNHMDVKLAEIVHQIDAETPYIYVGVDDQFPHPDNPDGKELDRITGILSEEYGTRILLVSPTSLHGLSPDEWRAMAMWISEQREELLTQKDSERSGQQRSAPPARTSFIGDRYPRMIDEAVKASLAALPDLSRVREQSGGLPPDPTPWEPGSIHKLVEKHLGPPVEVPINDIDLRVTPADLDRIALEFSSSAEPTIPSRIRHIGYEEMVRLNLESAFVAGHRARPPATSPPQTTAMLDQTSLNRLAAKSIRSHPTSIRPTTFDDTLSLADMTEAVRFGDALLQARGGGHQLTESSDAREVDEPPSGRVIEWDR